MENTKDGVMHSNSGSTQATGGIAMDGMLNKASSSAHAAVNSLAGAAEDAARKARPAIDQISAMAHNAVDKAAGAAGPAADWLAAQGNSINVTQKKLVADSSSYISANPFKAVGIAIAAGFLLTKVLRK